MRIPLEFFEIFFLLPPLSNFEQNPVQIKTLVPAMQRLYARYLFLYFFAGLFILAFQFDLNFYNIFYHTGKIVFEILQESQILYPCIIKF